MLELEETEIVEGYLPHFMEEEREARGKSGASTHCQCQNWNPELLEPAGSHCNNCTEMSRNLKFSLL